MKETNQPETKAVGIGSSNPRDDLKELNLIENPLYIIKNTMEFIIKDKKFYTPLEQADILSRVLFEKDFNTCFTFEKNYILRFIKE